VRGRRRVSSELPSDAGASAVEFALVCPLLFMLLFGIIQYGYGLLQVQEAYATVRDAARLAAVGVQSCPSSGTGFGQTIADLGADNGLPASAVQQVTLDWSGSGPTRNGTVKVTLQVQPMDLNVPFVPFPDTITVSSVARIEDLIPTATCTADSVWTQ